jgi:hypothetical protein
MRLAGQQPRSGAAALAQDLERADRGRRGRLDAELRVDVLEVVMDGPTRQAEDLGDLRALGDFSSGLIDPTKWFGTVATGGSGNPTTEVKRRIDHGKLHLRLDQYGLTTSNSGTSGGQFRLAVHNPVPITTMQAGVIVLSGEALLCPANAGATVRSRAAIVGSFFNDGSSTGAGDRTGDIIATVQKVADATLGDVIQAVISRCPDASCSSPTTLSFQYFTATWVPYQPHTLTLTWDAANDQFIYTAKPLRGRAETITLPYTQTDAVPPVVNFKQVQVNNSAANCNGSREHAFMDALFDNVMVNQ